MTQVTLSYAKILARFVEQLGLEAPKITCEQRDSGVFHAVIEVDLASWVSRGFRGPREFTGTSSTSARRAIRKAALNVLKRLEKSGLVKIRDFSRQGLKTWKRRVMEIAKACKEVVEERDELERNFAHQQKLCAKLLAENDKMKEEMRRLQEHLSYMENNKEENDSIIAENKKLKEKISAVEKLLS
ncbi:hypothetical protein ACP70R_046063 [Stipagrostis hirtigluma subsp. patula]